MVHLVSDLDMNDFPINRMTISDYNTKPVRGDRAILS